MKNFKQIIENFFPGLLITLILSIVFVLLLSTAIDSILKKRDLYTVGYNKGCTNGYDAGYIDGYNEGCTIDTDEIWEDVFNSYTFWDYIDKYPEFEDGYKHAGTIDYISEYNIDLENLDSASINQLLQNAYQAGYGDGCQYTMDYLDKNNNPYHPDYIE